MKTLPNTAVVLSLFILLAGCSKKNSGGDTNPPLDCSTVPKSFATHVNPVIQSFCNNIDCHNASSSNGPGPLTNYTQVFNARTQIRQAVASGFMPRNSSLTTAQKNAILCWIDSGAPDN